MKNTNLPIAFLAVNEDYLQMVYKQYFGKNKINKIKTINFIF
jgi:hypothetical protein